MTNQDSQPAKRFLRDLVGLQDLLGGHQDAEVAAAQLQALAERSMLPPGVLFAMGRLAQRYSVEAVQFRSGYERAYRRAVGKQWRRFHQRLRRAVEAVAAPSDGSVTGSAGTGNGRVRQAQPGDDKRDGR